MYLPITPITPRTRKQIVFDALRANNNPTRWCINYNCPDTNWCGTGRLHYRDNNCPPHRPFGGWWR